MPKDTKAIDEQRFWERVGSIIGERLVSWRGTQQADFERSKGVTANVAEKLIGQHSQIRLLQGVIKENIGK